MRNIIKHTIIWRGGIIKRKALFLTGIVLLACVAVTGYQFKDNNQLPILNSFSQIPNSSTFENPDKATKHGSSKEKPNQETSKQNSKKYSKNDVNQDSQSNVKKSNSQSIAGKYIEEPGAKAGTPKRIKIGGKQTDVVPVIQNGKQVGEIHIDPKTGKNVGGAGGAP